MAFQSAFCFDQTTRMRGRRVQFGQRAEMRLNAHASESWSVGFDASNIRDEPDGGMRGHAWVSERLGSGVSGQVVKCRCNMARHGNGRQAPRASTRGPDKRRSSSSFP